MPAKSKQQFKFMKAVENGYIKKPGLSSEKAHEFTEGITKPKFSKLKDYFVKKIPKGT